MPRENLTPRAVRLAEIRRQVKAGTYETQARLEGAVEAFLDSADARAVLDDTFGGARSDACDGEEEI